ncbi:MAG: ATP-binding protein, partial [Pseudomonadota bacterium]
LDRWPVEAPEAGRFSFAIARRDDAVEVGRPALAESFRLPGGYRLLVARDAGDLDLVRRRFLGAMLWTGGGVLIFGLATGWLLSRRVLLRVARAAEAGERIAAGQFDRRLPAAGRGDEFDRLAESVNAMMDRIEGLMRAMRIATDSISHDLRRPLTRLRARLEPALGQPGLGPDGIAAALAEVDRTVAILDNLLRIARAEAGSASVNFSDTDLAQLVEDAADLYRPLAEAGGLSLTVETEPLTRPVERQLMAEAVTNLIDNALKYAADPGGKIHVRLRRRPEGAAEILVRDTGPGIAAADRARVVERFVRLEPSRASEGAGLGLSLAAAVARLHGGDLVLGDARPGLSASLRF